MSHVSRALRALVPHVPCVIHVLVLDVPCALRSLVPYVPRALRALVPQELRTLRALPMPHVSYILLHFTCLVPCILWLVPYLLFCSSSHTCFRCFKPNILICISCLAAFMSYGSCAFSPWAYWVFYSLG